MDVGGIVEFLCRCIGSAGGHLGVPTGEVEFLWSPEVI